MRRCSGTYEPEFARSLDFLIEHGGDKTLKQLRSVFLDQGVWKSGSVHTLLPSVQAYLKRIGKDADFTERLKAAVREGSQREGAEEQAAREMKMLEQALNPRDTGALLDELISSSESPRTDYPEAITEDTLAVG